MVYGTREGQRIEAVPLDARLGLPEDRCSYLLRDWNQALVVEHPYGQVDAVLGRILGLKQSVASLETMTRTLAGAVAGYEATRPAPPPATGEQIVVLSADDKGVPLRKPADAPRPSPPTTTPGDRSPTARKWPYWARLTRSSPTCAPRWRWSQRYFAIPPPRDGRTVPRRPVPQEKRVCAVLPVAAAVTEALAPPRPVEVIFPWLQAAARRRDPDHPHLQV